MKNLLLAAAFASALHASAGTLSVPVYTIPATVDSTAPFSAAQTPENLINGAGLVDGRHDNESGARTMWHTAENPAPSAPAPGLAAAPAWVRFTFKEPRKIDA